MTRNVVLLLVLFAGCANVTTMKINRAADGTLAINSGKDVSIDALSYKAPNGETLEVKGYTSNANTAAIAAQAAREKQIIDGVLTGIQTGAKLGAAATGVPIL